MQTCITAQKEKMNALTRYEKWMAVLFIFGTLAVVMTAAAIGFAYAPPTKNLQHSPGDSFFWIAWLIIIPSWGVASWLVWLKRKVTDIRGAMVVFFWFLLSLIAFFPQTAATNESVLGIFVGDIQGIIESWLIIWLYSRYSKAARWWLLPLVIWFPITAIIKFINL
ncbi:hypothetical protein KDH_22810 [Dictyobacter sp. S3.2.2.5]|uniref:Uncharacterized protein n=1 Tax=Dictyobacter halimunensis TaxID=3026934 RepID=A0ABQ6FP27_9CHLR|nr:hypothetical protein KDH_22810 [Dictyobacter sp. S3.2.2.5]